MFPFFFSFDVVPVSDNKKLRQKIKQMLDFCLDMSISNSPSLILLGKTCIEENSPITVD